MPSSMAPDKHRACALPATLCEGVLHNVIQKNVVNKFKELDGFFVQKGQLLAF